MLKMTKAKLELLTDHDMHLMIEKGIRGGMSMISTRHAKSNNPYMTDYDSNLPTTYIQYLDATTYTDTRYHRNYHSVGSGGCLRKIYQSGEI